jgi:nitrate/nitrite-specific signal transduction histidine kinase
MSEPNQIEQAEKALREAHEQRRELALAYKRVFSSPDGKKVLANLLTQYPCARQRFETSTTQANPIAAIIGGIHFDGSAAVTNHILNLIDEAATEAPATPTVTGS